MDENAIARIKNDWAKVIPVSGAVMEDFYARLFRNAPSVRPLFPTDMSRQKLALFGMLNAVVNGLDMMDTLTPALIELGRTHKSYDLSLEHYKIVEDTLIETLRANLGDEIDSDAEDAWRTAYGIVAGVMQAAADKDAAA